MRIGMIGTGVVARTLGGRLAELGHDVMLGSRDREGALEGRALGSDQTLGSWLQDRPRVRHGTFAEAAAHGELLVNATSGLHSQEALAAAGSGHVADKILIDVANPLDFSAGMPPTLGIANTTSLGEELQKQLPETRVVKTLNTVSAAAMIDPTAVRGGAHTMFVCGNDQAAKDEVVGYLEDWFGWQDVLDLGDISGARGMEMYLPLWVRAMLTLQSPLFNVSVVRA